MIRELWGKPFPCSQSYPLSFRKIPMRGLLPYLLFFVIPTLFLVFGSMYLLHRKIGRTRAPVREKMPRPPGESLRQKIEDFDDQTIQWLLLALIVPLLMGITVLHGQGSKLFSIGIGMLIAYPICLFGIARMSSTLTERRNHWLGYRGERFVGRLLEDLRVDGYLVFHDIPFDGFNIDHALVGPAGVFAIETKTRRKKNTGKNGALQKVLFDGKTLKSPDWEDAHGIEQAQRNARHLANTLSKATGEKVMAVPVLVLPGWWVERTTLEPVRVLNPKEVLTHVRKQRPILSDKQVSQISYQLAQMTEIEF